MVFLAFLYGKTPPYAITFLRYIAMDVSSIHLFKLIKAARWIMMLLHLGTEVYKRCELEKDVLERNGKVKRGRMKQHYIYKAERRVRLAVGYNKVCCTMKISHVRKGKKGSKE
ncbi:hypothetical protein PUN28_002675 [Cardiocondyla obscurior]|uniref:Uncharacterized protein n=1 Tax=Cardiocondyla obscurior TaxID=286306 RepID=A0AAW2GVQ2_9HYME